MNRDDVLNLKVSTSDFDYEPTIREYFSVLLQTLWREEECFSAKRPFGNSGWQYDVYTSLIKAGVVEGSLDDEDCVEKVDTRKADAYIQELIDYAMRVK